MRQSTVVLAMIAVLISSGRSASADPALGPNLTTLADVSLAEATANDGPAPSNAPDEPVVRRGSLDVDVVVELVQTRLRAAGVKAATRALRKYMRKDLRPWMRDLFSNVVTLATNRTQSAKLAGEAMLRMGGRVLLAATVVRTKFVSNEALLKAAQAAGWMFKSQKLDNMGRVMEDWLYWRLAQLPILEGSALEPTCSGDGAQLELCELIEKEADRVAKLDEITGFDKIIGAITAIQRVRKIVEAKGLSLGETLGELVDVATKTAGDFGLDLGQVDAVIAWADALTADYDAIRNRLQGLKERLGELQTAYTTYQRDPQKFPDLKVAVRAVQVALTSPSIGTHDFLASIASVTRLPGLQTLFAGAKDSLTAMATFDLNLAEAKFKAALEAIGPAQLHNVVKIITVEDLTNRISQLKLLVAAIRASTSDLIAGLSIGKAEQLTITIRKFLDELALTIKIVTPLLPSPPPIDLSKLTELRGKAEQLAGWCFSLLKLADPLRDDKVGALLEQLAAIATGAEGKRVFPLFELLEPVLPQIVDGRLEARHLFAAYAKLGPRDLLSTLQLPKDIDTACAPSAKTPATCWAVRLVLMAQEAVTWENDAIQVRTESVVEDLVEIAGSRRNQSWKPYFHLGVGTGLLVDDDPRKWKEALPLVNEQIGLGMKLCGGDVSLRLAVYGSGLLYRVVVDSEESDGVIFGVAAMVDLFGDVELYVSAATLLAPSPEAGEDSNFDRIWAIGAQIPLADYLKKIAD